MASTRRRPLPGPHLCFSDPTGRSYATWTFELSRRARSLSATSRGASRGSASRPGPPRSTRRQAYPDEIFNVFRDAGLLGLTIPAAYGGSGAGFLALALAVEEVAKYCCSSGLMLLLTALPTQPIVLGGTEEQKKRVSAADREGRAAGRFRPDRAQRRLRRRRHPGAGGPEGRRLRDQRRKGVHLRRRRRRLRDDVRQDRPRRAGSRGISGFIVPKTTPGFSVARLDEKMGVRGVATALLCLPGLRRAGGEPARRQGERGLQDGPGHPEQRPAHRRRARSRPGRRRARLRARFRPAARGVRRANRRSAGDSVHVRRHGHPDRSGAPADLPGGLAGRPGALPEGRTRTCYPSRRRSRRRRR